jgi:toxin ParE1/3/4
MTFEFLPEARVDLTEAALYYKSKEAALGWRFRNEVARVIERIIADPLLWRERSAGFRRANCPVFPYYVAYVVRLDKIVIVAIAHGRRKPGFWQGRLRSDY